MPFEEFNKLSYQEQCDYISTLELIVTNKEKGEPLDEIVIDCSVEEYVQRYHLVSLEELMQSLKIMIVPEK